jgi:hypothetical protein
MNVRAAEKRAGGRRGVDDRWDSKAALHLKWRPTAEVGREYALPTGRFREAEFHWPLSGDEFEDRADATRSVAVIRLAAIPMTALEVQRPFAYA